MTLFWRIPTQFLFWEEPSTYKYCLKFFLGPGRLTHNPGKKFKPLQGKERNIILNQRLGIEILSRIT